MKTQRYRLRLTGLHEAEGQIRAASLVDVLKALVQAAKSPPTCSPWARAARVAVSRNG